MRTTRALGLAIALIGAGAVSTPATGQARFTWPEPENLQRLPADFTPERLRAVMTGFSRALGVRCSHCHVAPAPDAPLTEHDFVSDDNPNKNIAREMLDLLGAVNDKLDEIQFTEPNRVNMWCHTCHRGLPRPSSLAEVLTATLETEGLDATLTRFRELRAEHYGTTAYDFSEAGIEGMAQQLVQVERVDHAVALMELNVEYYPDSARACANLGGLLARQEGQEERAIEMLEKALKLDASLAPYVQPRLEKLRSSDE